MGDPAVYTTLSQVTVLASGSSCASNAILTGSTFATSAHSNYLESDLALYASCTGAASNGSVVSLYARDLNIDGTNDATVPGASHKARFIGNFQVPGNAGSQTFYALMPSVPNSITDVEFFIENNTNTTIAAGWTLKATPKSYLS